MPGFLGSRPSSAVGWGAGTDEPGTMCRSSKLRTSASGMCGRAACMMPAPRAPARVSCPMGEDGWRTVASIA